MGNNISERITKIKEYFKGMQVDELDGHNIIYVMVSFPPKWFVDDEVEKKFNISVGRSEDGTYFFCGDMFEVGFETIFDAIDYNINKMISAQERAKLLKEKIMELKTIFEDESISIDRLKNYEFVYKLKKKDKSTKQQTNIINQEIPDNDEPTKDKI